MIIRIATDGCIHVDDPANFRKFKVVCEAAETAYAAVAGTNPGTITFDDAKTAWVSIAALRAFEGLAGDQAWQTGFANMIKAAEPHGWISRDGRAIKAHVDWAA